MEVVIELPDDFNKLCRTCMAIVENETSFDHFIFKENQTTKICYLLNSLINTKLLPNDGLPQTICDTCYNQLQMFYNFKKQCCNVQNTLMGLLKYYNKTADGESAKEASELHQNEEEEEEEMFYCNICSKEFVTYYALSQHKVMHNEKNTLTERFNNNVISEKQEEVKTELNMDLLLIIAEKKSEERKNTESNTGKEQEKISCRNCNELFYEQELNMHDCAELSVDVSERKRCENSCDVCDRSFSDDLSLSLHFVNHALIVESNTDPKIFSQYVFCNTCGETFDTKQELNQHVYENHKEAGTTLFKCSKCNNLYKSDLELLKHDKFTNHLNDTIWTDVLRKNSAKINFTCPICQETFKSRELLNQHSVQHAIKKIRCRTCKKFFATKSAYNKHLETHPNYKYTCSECGKFLGSKGALKTHMLGIHSDKAPFICPTCGKGFKTANRLYSHKIIHSDTKQFICSYCGYSTHKGGDLRTHMRTHTSERPYKCDFVNCGKYFKTSSHRSEHIRRHLQIRKFECSVCSMVFGHLSTLKTHLMQHTGEKPFSCIICNVSFRRKHHLKFHMRKHDPDKS